MTRPTKLNIGCGMKQYEGYANLDAEEYGQDIQGDLLIYMLTQSKARPGEWEEIRAEHVIEHFPPGEVEAIFNMAHKMLKKDGLFHIVVPGIRNPRAYVLGHRSYFTTETFLDLTRSYQKYTPKWKADKVVENERGDVHAWLRKI